MTKKVLFVLTGPFSSSDCFFASAEVPGACDLQGATPYAEERRASAPHAEEGPLQSQVELLACLLL